MESLLPNAVTDEQLLPQGTALQTRHEHLDGPSQCESQNRNKAKRCENGKAIYLEERQLVGVKGQRKEGAMSVIRIHHVHV